MSPVLNNSVTDFVIDTKPRSLTLDKWRKKSEQSNPHTCDRKNTLSYPVHSEVLNKISNTSDTSSDEFESLIDRIKCITQRTPAATSGNLKGKRMPVTGECSHLFQLFTSWPPATNISIKLKPSKVAKCFDFLNIVFFTAILVIYLNNYQSISNSLDLRLTWPKDVF